MEVEVIKNQKIKDFFFGNNTPSKNRKDEPFILSSKIKPLLLSKINSLESSIILIKTKPRSNK